VAVDDLVSVATRLGLLAGDGEILITEATYRMVREATEVERLEAPIELRGGGEPAVAWRLVGVHDPGGDAFGTLADGT
jgi:class 3 adenylate cyclase